MSDVTLHLGDCLEIVPTLPPQSVDAILTDLPYGTTACSWDEVIPFEPMWAAVKHVLKPRGVFVTTASQPFTSRLVCSNLDWFKYEWIWEKSMATGGLDANRKPLKIHENIVVFCKGWGTYNPQYFRWKNPRFNIGVDTKVAKQNLRNPEENIYRDIDRPDWIENGIRFPVSVFYSNNKNHNGHHGSVPNKLDHPTQKPVSLYTYLTLTYTNEGDTVLDMCAGSGTTGVSAVQTGRNFIGIEKEPKYFEIMQRRIKQAQMQLRLGI